MSKNAILEYDGARYELPVFEGTEGEAALDISKLRSQSGLITFDPGYQNTASCLSAITFIDGEKGILRYRGYPIEEIAEKSTFIQTAYLLIFGELPTQDESVKFSALLNSHSLIHEDMIHFLERLSANGHPMNILSSMVNSLSIFYPDFWTHDDDPAAFMVTAARLISQIRTIAAFSYKKSIGEPLVYPRHDLRYCGNFLNMMFSSPVNPYTVDPEIER
ncbi:MAG: citrate/2-methylcitrate synthase [Spirochaetota bacterium]